MSRAPRYRTPSSLATYLIRLARRRALKQGIPCSLTPEDVVVPTYCPALGLRLERNVGGKAQGKASPTLDRIDPKKGYVPGNVIVLSAKANQMKSTGTPEQLERVAAFVRQLIQ
jgi:hypothetical protein